MRSQFRTQPDFSVPIMRRNPRRGARGFILILVVGALAVLAILGLSFSEQSRADLMGARNVQDLTASDSIAQSGFELALRMLADDTNVWTEGRAWDPALGSGWTSRWGYNPYYDVDVGAGGLQQPGAAPNRADPRNYLDSWQLAHWNEAVIGSNKGFGYGFKFTFPTDTDIYSQRHPTDGNVMSDIWPLQPLARGKKFPMRYGKSYCLVQIGITPTDGGINLNDVFQPDNATYKAGEELPGTHDTALYKGTKTADEYASPNRRTIEYILGKRPEYANLATEFRNYATNGGPAEPIYDEQQFVANQPAGSYYSDNGVYNFASAFEPSGRSKSTNVPDYDAAWWNRNRLLSPNGSEPMLFFNAGAKQPNRYNFEGSRYVMWSSTTSMSTMYHYNAAGVATQLRIVGGWWPSGRYKDKGLYPTVSGAVNDGTRDLLFHGFGFDLMNPKRAGEGALEPDLYVTDEFNQKHYTGAGVYGHPKPRSFQKHFISAVAGGRFWTDLMAAWYFGGAPGYTNQLGNHEVYYNNWAHLGSSYDSIGMGSHWMPPTTHVWLPGSFNQSGQLTTTETQRGLTRDPGTMPPAKPAATYTYPLKKWGDDYGTGNAHFLATSMRSSIRAHGIQENWSLPQKNDNNGKFFDAININVANFQVIYGLLTPEKIPSMMNRTVVAPHLHFKARVLDAAYEGMETFARYTIASPPSYDPSDVAVANRYGVLADPAKYFDPGANKVLPYNPNPTPTVPPAEPAPAPKKLMSPGDYKYSLHRHKDQDRPSSDKPLEAAKDARIWGKMDFKTIDPLTNEAADDVYTDAHYNLSLSPNSTSPTDALDTLPKKSSAMPRPDKLINWGDWFSQRNVVIENNGPDIHTVLPYKPENNRGIADALGFPEGTKTIKLPVKTRTEPLAVPHPKHGLPNPDYLLLYPGSHVSLFWADQYRRYFPIAHKVPEITGSTVNSDPGTGLPMAPPNEYKMVDPIHDIGTKVYPGVPVPKGDPGGSNPFVPAINKDEAWRITRAGQKYQEIVANEMLDYQINPWWPNPCIPYKGIAIPLDLTPMVSKPRENALLAIENKALKWQSLEEAKDRNAGGLNYQIPDYYAYFNRFWCRSGHKYTPGEPPRDAGLPDRTKFGEWYRDYTVVESPTKSLLLNPSENLRIFPQALQYFGTNIIRNAGDKGVDSKIRDRVLDFPQNTLEDQSGGEWRYLSGTAANMNEGNMRVAPARNHPYKNWGDFVGMLGHLVYRSPMETKKADGTILRDRWKGVDARDVCHGASVDPRNAGQFFDGSKIDTADCLQNKIVANRYFWPISANYGNYYDPVANTDVPYPPVPGVGGWDKPEWERRIDEWRGRDAAGLRVEQHYISESAANDVLVNLSNGKIGPIDFDGNGRIEMTRKADIPEVDKYWQGYPWHQEAGATKVEARTFETNTADLNYGVLKPGWVAVNQNEVIKDCVTLPIKFRSNTFRISVMVEITDKDYKTVYATQRFSRVYSRVPKQVEGEYRVNQPYTGEFILHGSRTMTKVDPYQHWLGAE
jgi:hypothetical protein